MKAKTLLVAAVMFFAFTAAAFAQATFQVGSIPVTAVTATGQTEGTGAITFSVVSGTTVAGTLSISYGSNVIITSAFGNVTIAPVIAGLDVNTAASTYNPGVLVVNIPAGLTAGASFTVSNLRVAVAGTGLTSLSASISSVANAIVAGQTSVTVISSISNGLGSASSSAASLNGVTSGSATATLKVKEGYLNAFNTADYGGIGFPVWVRFTLSALPPAGVSVTFNRAAATDGTGTPAFAAVDPSTGAALASDPVISSTSTSLSVYYALATNSDPSKIETLSVSTTVAISSSATLPIPATTITYTATLAPIGTALDSSGAPISPAATKAPRFTVLEVGPATVFTIGGSSTALLIPYASTVSASGYNTGIAVANATLDKGKTVLGLSTAAATPQVGGITFYFYPQQNGSTAGVPFSYTTSASSPGTGLNASGLVPAGSTYTVLLSQLLAAAQAPADFNGHIYLVTGFTNAHCQYIITDFKAFANGALALILPNDRSSTPESLGQ